MGPPVRPGVRDTQVPRAQTERHGTLCSAIQLGLRAIYLEALLSGLGAPCPKPYPDSPDLNRGLN